LRKEEKAKKKQHMWPDHKRHNKKEGQCVPIGKGTGIL